MNKQFFIYIMGNKNNNVLYTGVTNNLTRRTWEHKNGLGSKFTAKYRVHIKAGSRKRKLELITALNLDFRDLYNI